MMRTLVCKVVFPQDKGSRAQSSKALEVQFRRAVDEALEAYREQKAKRNLQELRWSEKSNQVSVKAEKETKISGFPLGL